MQSWKPLAARVLAGGLLTREEALAVLRSDDLLLPEILADAWQVRRFHHGNTVKVHVLANAKSGNCPEDCSYCSQSGRVDTPIDRYALVDPDALLDQAREASRAGAWKFCIVTATRGPSDRDLDVLCDAVRRIKREVPIRICTSLGLLTREKARRLAEAGVDRFNHNLETSRRHFPRICTTHTYDDRVTTLRFVKEAGLEICSGGIIGMGEADEDVADLALAARDLDVDSIPVNFLDPRPGTPLAGAARPTPAYCLKVLCLFRFLNPAKDIRAAGGREANLRSMQSLALYPANSIFTNGYLTTPGHEANEDLRMIRDMGFQIVTETEHQAAAEVESKG